MSDVARTNALARRDALAAEINKLQQQLEEARRESKRIEEWLATWNEFAGTAATDFADVVFGPHPEMKSEPRRGRSVNPPKEEIAEFARRLAVDHNEPVSRKAIMAALQLKGITLEGTDPDMVLSTMLWRMKDRLVRLKGLGYWPREIDYPKAAYTAGVTPQDEVERRRLEMMYDHPSSIASMEASIASEDGEI